MGTVGAVGHFLGGNVQGEKNWIWLSLQFESAGLAPVGEEDPSRYGQYVSQSWNGAAEMQSLSHTEPAHPVMLGLAPFPKAKESQ